MKIFLSAIGVLLAVAFIRYVKHRSSVVTVEHPDLKPCLLCGCTIPKRRLDRLPSFRQILSATRWEEGRRAGWKDYRA